MRRVAILLFTAQPLRIFILLVRQPLAVLCVVLTSFTVACSDSGGWWDPLPAGTIVLERSSPNFDVSAVVRAREVPGSYALEIRDAHNREALSSRVIAAPVGYHSHLITLDWSRDGKRVIATIDHDFGDDNRVFELWW